MFKHILVPIAPGDAERSIESVKLAKRILSDGGKISAVSVLEVPPAYIADYLGEADAKQVREREENRMKLELNAIAETEVHIVQGHPARQILDEAAKLKVDCIVIASHRPGPRDFLIGSTASRVVRRASCSVVVTR